MDRRHVLASLGTMLGGCLRLSSNETQTEADGEVTSTEPPTPDDGDGIDTETATATGTKSPTADVEYPLGLDDSGISLVLVDNHLRQLAETTYRHEQTIQDIAGGEIHESVTYRVDGEAGRAVITRGAFGDLTEYRTRDGHVWCLSLSGSGTTYGQSEVPYGWMVAGIESDIEDFLRAGAWGSPELIERDPAVWQVTADGVGDPSPLLDNPRESLERFSGTIEVTERPVIRSLNAEWDIVTGDELNSETLELTVSDIGSVTVDEPEWVSTAREEAAQLSATVSDDRRHIQLTHDGGNPVVAGTTVAINEMGLQDTQTTAPFEAGQTMFIYAEDGHTRLARGSMRADADPVEIPDNDQVWFGLSYRRGQYYHSGAAGILPYRPERQD